MYIFAFTCRETQRGHLNQSSIGQAACLLKGGFLFIYLRSQMFHYQALNFLKTYEHISLFKNYYFQLSQYFCICRLANQFDLRPFNASEVSVRSSHESRELDK